MHLLHTENKNPAAKYFLIQKQENNNKLPVTESVKHWIFKEQVFSSFKAYSEFKGQIASKIQFKPT